MTITTSKVKRHWFRNQSNFSIRAFVPDYGPAVFIVAYLHSNIHDLRKFSDLYVAMEWCYDLHHNTWGSSSYDI